MYCLSKRGLKKALPTLPQSWHAPNISLPSSLPAVPVLLNLKNHFAQVTGDAEDRRQGGELELLLLELGTQKEEVHLVNFFRHFSS